MSKETNVVGTNETTESVIPEAFLDLLESAALAHIATIGPTGAPQVSPVWFGWDGTHIQFSQSPNAQKLKNLRRDSRVSLSIVDPTNEYRYLEVRGRVTDIEEDPGYTFLNKMAGKYWGMDTYPHQVEESVPVIIVIEPLGTSQMNETAPARD